MSTHESVVTAHTPAAGMHPTARCVLRSFARARAPAALFFTAAVVSVSVAGSPETRIGGVVGSDDKTVAHLTIQLAALQMRVKKLEGELIDVQRSVHKADTPDADGGSDKPDKKGADGGKNTSSGGGPGAKDSSPAGGSKSGSSSSDGDTSGPLKDVFPTMTLRAPFVVVDSSGKTIFRVNDPRARGSKSGGDRGVYIYGDAGAANFALTTVYSGGKMMVQTDSGAYSMSVGAVDTAAGMKFRAQNKTRTYVGLDTRGKGLLAVYTGDSEQPVAGVQSTDEDKGLVAVFNSGTPVAFLSQSGAHPGGGNVTTTDPGGNGVFSAGYDGEGGAACVNHKQSMHCVGIGLPLGGGQ
jgi:hypothetical protein